ncbi:MAG: hypothetical protein AAFX87_30280 [Bacteroidota bacterium]
MRISITLLLTIVSIALNAQEYESLYIEKTKDPDSDNKIFTSGKGLIYQLSIYESGEKKRLVFSDRDWDLIQASEEPSAKDVERIIYLTASVKKSKRTNKRQTEVIIAFEPNGRTFQNTGIVENDQNIWLHPPRSRFFKVLELCPFPYVRLSSDSLAWTDKLSISQRWQDERWATWEGEQVLDLTYKNEGFENIETNLGEIRCLITKSKAKSTIGETFLTTYFNSKLGFVKMEYDILGKYKVIFQLAETKEFGEIQSPQDYMIKNRR